MAASTATLNMIMKARDKASGKLGKVAGSLGKVAAVAGGVMVAGLGAATAAATKLALDAAKIEVVENTFTSLADTIGADVTESMNQLREASRGMVSDFDLMQASNKFVAMGLAGSSEEAAKLTEISTQLGMAMGEDATFSAENFALMLANQSIPRLDSFGISSGKVRERIKELMEANKDMTRETAFMTATMEAAEVTMGKVGEQGEGAQASVARLTAKFKNIKATLGKALLPILDKVLEAVMPLVEAFGKWAEDILPPLVRQLEDFIDKFKLGGISTIFEQLSDWFLLYGPGIIDFTKRIAKGFADFGGKLAGKIMPTVIEQVGKFSSWFEENEPLIREFTQKIGQAWDSISPHVIAYWDVVKPIVDGVMKQLRLMGTLIMQVATGDWTGAWETIKAMALNTWNIVKESFDEFFNWVANWLGYDWEEIKQTWKDVWHQIEIIVPQVWRNIRVAVIEWLAKIVQTISDSVENFLLAGRNLINGLWEGMRQGFANLLIRLQNKLWEITNLTNRIYQNRSPSKVFMDIGENLMAGLAMGIEEGIRMPELAMQGASASITAVPSSPPQATSKTLVIENVNITNGMDLNEFQAMLRRTLG